MKKLFVCVLSAAMLLSVSCSKEEPQVSVSESNIIGAWKSVSVEAVEVYEGEREFYSAVCSDNTFYSIYTFNEDYTMSVYIFDAEEGDAYTNRGTWKLNGKVISMYVEDGADATILSLTANTMKIQKEEYEDKDNYDRVTISCKRVPVEK